MKVVIHPALSPRFRSTRLAVNDVEPGPAAHIENGAVTAGWSSSRVVARWRQAAGSEELGEGREAGLGDCCGNQRHCFCGGGEPTGKVSLRDWLDNILGAVSGEEGPQKELNFYNAIMQH